jgi:N-terminal C2 in EEIG1 and EHBP1 proteins
MSNLLKKIGAEKVKHVLDIEIHYIRVKLPDTCPVYIEVQRGKKMKKETQTMNYSPYTGIVQFDYPLSFEITMHKKGEKFVKKNFVIKLFEMSGKTKLNNGRVKIDFSHIPVLKKPIIKREVPLQNCTDKTAIVCITVRLDPIFVVSDQPIKPSQSPNSPIAFPTLPEKKFSNMSSIKPAKTNDPEATAIKARSSESYREEKKVNQDEIKFIESSDIIEVNDEIRPALKTDSFSSVMSFSDLILNPKESEISSETSSSDEEMKELPPDRLVAHSVPKASMSYATPNESSKSAQILKSEERSGIATTKEPSQCAGCIAF